MKIAEYKLHGNPLGKGMTTPGFIQNGGYYCNPDDHTMLGFVDDPAEYYLPERMLIMDQKSGEKRALKISNAPLWDDDELLTHLM